MGVKITDMTQGTSNTVLGHEQNARSNGTRVVLFGDGSVRMLNQADFDKAPKARPK
jgi:hypothetical protein